MKNKNVTLKRSPVLSQTSKYLIVYVAASFIATAFLVYSGILDAIEKWAERNELYPAHFESIFVVSIVLGIAVVFFLFHNCLQFARIIRLRSKYNSELSNADEEEILDREDIESVLPPVLAAKKELERSFDAIADMVILCDADGMIHRCNRSFKNFVGSEYSEILGRSIGSTLARFGVETENLELKDFHARLNIMGKWFAVTSYPYNDVEIDAVTRTVLVMRDLTASNEPGKVHFLWGWRRNDDQRRSTTADVDP